MEKTIPFTVNGQVRSVTTDPERSLLEVLREEFQLTGTKFGCGEGQCRACTVLLDGKSVASCLTSIGDAAHQTILTIEGLAKAGMLHPVQEAFMAEGAFQCGYCTSGMIMGVVGLLNGKSKPTESEVLSQMQKHICRCCSYPKILSAIRRVGGMKERVELPQGFGLRQSSGALARNASDSKKRQRTGAVQDATACSAAL